MAATDAAVSALLAAPRAAGGLPGAAVAAVEVVPSPGFVVKTVVSAGGGAVVEPTAVAIAPPGTKLFVNVVVSEAVPAFARAKHVAGVGEEAREEEGISIPLSVGPLRADVDKGGAACAVVDAIVHPAVVRDCDSGVFRHFVCELALQYVERKYGMTVSHAYKLPALAYKGDRGAIPPQRVRATPRRAPGIRDGDEEAPDSNASPMALLVAAGALHVPRGALPVAGRGGGGSAGRATGSVAPRGPGAGASAQLPLDMRVLGEDEAKAPGRVLRSVSGSVLGGQSHADAGTTVPTAVAQLLSGSGGVSGRGGAAATGASTASSGAAAAALLAPATTRVVTGGGTAAEASLPPRGRATMAISGMDAAEGHPRLLKRERRLQALRLAHCAGAMSEAAAPVASSRRDGGGNDAFPITVVASATVDCDAGGGDAAADASIGPNIPS